MDQDFPIGPYGVYFELLAWVDKYNAIFHNAFDHEKDTAIPGTDAEC